MIYSEASHWGIANTKKNSFNAALYYCTIYMRNVQSHSSSFLLGFTNVCSPLHQPKGCRTPRFSISTVTGSKRAKVDLGLNLPWP